MVTYLQQALQFFTRYRETLWKYAYVVVISLFAAKAVNLFLAYKFLPYKVPERVETPRNADATASGPKVNIQQIIARNLFNSEIQIVKTNTAIVEGQIYPSTLAVELLGTVVFQKTRYSAALVKDRSTNKAEYVGVNDTLQTAQVVKIERFRIIVSNNGRLESLELKLAENKISGSTLFSQPQVNTTPSQPSGGAGDGAELEELGPGRFAVPQNLLDSTMSNFSQVLTQARMVPNLTPDNKTDGFKIFQIKDGSIYKKLGLKDNDIIKRVNGTDLDSFEKATSLFTALRNEKTISIDVVRNGSRINYTYEIR